MEQKSQKHSDLTVLILNAQEKLRNTRFSALTSRYEHVREKNRAKTEAYEWMVRRLKELREKME